jgi:hypothetical protein
VAPDLYAYLLPLFPRPPEREGEAWGEVVLDDRSIAFHNSSSNRNNNHNRNKNENSNINPNNNGTADGATATAAEGEGGGEGEEGEDTCALDDLLRQGEALSVDRQILSLMSCESAVTDTPLPAPTPADATAGAGAGAGTGAGTGAITRQTKRGQGQYHHHLAAPSPPPPTTLPLPLMRPHLGLCGACAALIQTLIHRHDPIRSAGAQIHIRL